MKNRLVSIGAAIAVATGALIGAAPAASAASVSPQATYRLHYFWTTTKSSGYVVCRDIMHGVVIYQTYVGSRSPAPWYTTCRVTLQSAA